LSLIEKCGSIDCKRLSGGNRFVNAKGGKRRADNVLEADGRGTLLPHAAGERVPLGAMAFILMPAGMDGLFAPAANKFKAAKVVENRGFTSAENLDAFF
jgi:hypothetical protein